MFFRLFFLLTIIGWLHVQCYVPVPLIYRKAATALRHYSSSTNSNPIIHSLLNVLVYDKRAKAFISDKAIEKALDDVKRVNKNDESVLRQLIYRGQQPSEPYKLSDDLKQEIYSTLDAFFSHSNTDDYESFDLSSGKKKT